MSTKTTLVAAISAPLLVIAAIASLAAAIAAPDDSTVLCAPAPGGSRVAGLSALGTQQLANARIIAQVGMDMGVPMPGETIALATALQESGLQNLTYGDRDSLGLFQQRPSQGWGTPAQILDPVYASGHFYRHLLMVPGWRSMPTTQAAQAVQRSAYPEAYAKWEREARALAAAMTGSAVCTAGDSGDNTAEGAAVDAAHYRIPSGTPAPIAAVITFALAQLGRPYAYGATGPNAYDCSGLMVAAYARIGVHLPRATYQQVNAGTPVYSLAQLKPGDLLFIPGTDGTPQAPGHVGMYLGNGTLIHAPQTGQTVRLSPLSQWAGSLVAIRRVL
ncbi:C40 family peptidase [Actinocrinis puniceicyclus]|uniref:C40 family peptidase n=1 Tax=Actinocrinis puniceicyclus TaxID=977794 RepID=A0A8J8BE34_9ACTN|nr:C40 family peptidase [Actinocrinis puniceicyclus]MBS2965933.1 C40 family peptidase [Actinocrinis puniceicyclus]